MRAVTSPVALAGGIVLTILAVAVSARAPGMTGHMIGHMMLVAVAAPCVALGLAEGRLDPARRWPAIVTPLAMSLVELVAVWGWHVPAARMLAAGTPGFVAEQASFLGAGVLLWSAALAGGGAAGIGALLLTSMHMTLLGALVTLASRPLYPIHAMHAAAGLDPLTDQQLSGVAMLTIGGISYLAGGLALLARLLGAAPDGPARNEREARA